MYCTNGLIEETNIINQKAIHLNWIFSNENVGFNFVLHSSLRIDIFESSKTFIATSEHLRSTWSLYISPINHLRLCIANIIQLHEFLVVYFPCKSLWFRTKILYINIH